MSVPAWLKTIVQKYAFNEELSLTIDVQKKMQEAASLPEGQYQVNQYGSEMGGEPGLVILTSDPVAASPEQKSTHDIYRSIIGNINSSTEIDSGGNSGSSFFKITHQNKSYMVKLVKEQEYKNMEKLLNVDAPVAETLLVPIYCLFHIPAAAATKNIYGIIMPDIEPDIGDAVRVKYDLKGVINDRPRSVNNEIQLMNYKPENDVLEYNDWFKFDVSDAEKTNLQADGLLDGEGEPLKCLNTTSIPYNSPKKT